jgi:uncharacterized protein YqgV (UPF0045/DUF77 family)
MKRFAQSCSILTGIFILLALSLIPLRGAVMAEPEVATPAETDRVDPAESQKPAVHPVMAEIQAIMEAQKIKLTELNTAMTETEELKEIIRIQREIEQVKVKAELDMFRVQIRHAEKIGNTAAAEFLQGLVERITARLETEENRRAQQESTQQ